MKIIALPILLLTFNAFAEIFICNTQELGAGYRIEVETHFNQPVARFKVFKWSSAPPPAFGDKLILQGRGDLTINQKIPRTKLKGPQEDYTKWNINSPDIFINFIHYGVAHTFGKVGTLGAGLPGNFLLKKSNLTRNISCQKKK